MDDATLVALLKADIDDAQAFKTLFDHHYPMTLRIVNGYYIRDYSRDDWLQEARIAMVEAIKRYSFTRGAKFGTFYGIVLKSHLQSLLRSRQADKRAIELTSVPLAAIQEVTRVYGNWRQQEDDYLLGLDLGEVLASFTPLEAESFLIALRHEPVAAIADRARERTRNKLRRYLADTS